MLAARSAPNEQLLAKIAEVHCAEGAAHIVVVVLLVIQTTTPWAPTGLALPSLKTLLLLTLLTHAPAIKVCLT